MRIKNLKLSLILIGISGAFVACSKDDDKLEETPNYGRMSINAKASYSPEAGKNGAQRSSSDIELSRFLVNFKEIELEYDDIIDDGDNIYNGEDEIELKGPFEVDLLSPVPIPLVEFRVPNGRLEEIEFEFDKSSNPDSEIYNQSMRMDGTINGTPFVFWHDFEDEIELEFDDDNNNSVINGDLNHILINFDLNAVFDPETGVDLSLAADGNGNGIIEIGPRDEDGNNALAEAIKRAIKNQIELLEDHYD
ncbi:hypothetical protein EI546_08255 [Aequorivita sp. H23M31]|uniref:DUF4382 domain-containing protein n=1 Tax=Aequorivita ciconiae TaxID=2494375 RepID=A0A410G370_9FLAO|nr:hypothetical protein [Aequorivita sp. H23M31]QAA81716.1 hypothetical protein EI546_08255 [Aequorivita sp. H23M31]